MNANALICAAIVGLSGVLIWPIATTKSEVVKTERVEMMVVHKKNPKHFSITLREVNTGVIAKHSSKWCSPHQRYSVGRTVMVTKETLHITNRVSPQDPPQTRWRYNIC